MNAPATNGFIETELQVWRKEKKIEKKIDRLQLKKCKKKKKKEGV